ncbi:MAG: LOG family protein YgdH [Gammaproteobacteria bacterium]|nr:LOG family protein YgdH [Gammaproteobacteria bacterium]
MTLTRNIVERSSVIPEGSLAVLSQAEVNDLCVTTRGPLYDMFRRCALAALTCGMEVDSALELLAVYADFDVKFEQAAHGLRLHLFNAPAHAFVDGRMIRGIREHLSAVLRDIVYINRQSGTAGGVQDAGPSGITHTVFQILRQASLLVPGPQRGVAVCWGGHSITRPEYDYCKAVGYQMGLRGLEICTGCGPGAMKGPMKGATIAHAKQRITQARYIGLTEPGIIAAEAPNPIVSDLVILPDVEKRLEGFMRLGHGVVVFPGGVGTAEEILFALGVLAHPDNAEFPFPLIFTGPADSAGYFGHLDGYIRRTLGERFAQRYQIILDDPPGVAAAMRRGVDRVLDFREVHDDATYFNWSLRIDERFQAAFSPTHEAMAGLELSRDLPMHVLVSNLRRAFSGLVSGNVKEEGMRAIATHGPFELRGDPQLMAELDQLLRAFAAQGRMRLEGRPYLPCYRLRC